MKVLLKFSLGKDSVITLGRLLDNPDITDIALVYHPMPAVTHGTPTVSRDGMDILENTIFSSLLCHDKISYVFPITYEEHELNVSNTVTETLNPSEWFLMTGDLDSVLTPEYLMKIVVKYGYRGLLTDKLSNSDFINCYEKYITTTLVRSGMTYKGSSTQKNAQLSMLGNKFTNTEILLHYKEKPYLRHTLETIVVESPLYGSIPEHCHNNLVIDLNTINLEDALFDYTDTVPVPFTVE